MNYWFKANRPEYVYLAAGTVGGIYANATRPAEFLYDNMLIHATVVHAAHLYGVRKLLYLGSSCIYPRASTQPMTEEQLLTGALEPTNESYAIAKIAGIKLCEAYRRQYGSNFISAMPTNLYGPNDNFDLTSGHVMPAMIRKFHEAKQSGVREVVIWGSGAPRREFLHVDDLADACVFLMRSTRGQRHQRRDRGGHQHPRARRRRPRRSPCRRGADVRRVQARRDAAQAARRLAPPCSRLASLGPAAGRHRLDLPVVPREPRPPASVPRRRHGLRHRRRPDQPPPSYDGPPKLRRRKVCAT